MLSFLRKQSRKVTEAIVTPKHQVQNKKQTIEMNIGSN